MNTKARNYLRGVGSVMNLSPVQSLRQFAPRLTGAERMTGHFAHVGEAVGRACGTYSNVQTPRAKAKTA